MTWQNNGTRYHLLDTKGRTVADELTDWDVASAANALAEEYCEEITIVETATGRVCRVVAP